MDFNNLLYNLTGQIGIITINRPGKLNALNHETLTELDQLLEIIKSDDSKVIIITGSGEKAFVAGADINEINKLDEKSGAEFSKFGQEVFNKIEQLGKPVIAAVNGFALGGGCELALACHIRLASEDAKFGQPEIKLGIIPGYGGTQRLPRIIGFSNAAELLLTGNTIDAYAAEKLGLVNKVVGKEELMREAINLAQKICSFSSLTIRKILEAILFTGYKNTGEGLANESALFGACCATEDFKEGTEAFLQKRPPVFKNK
jgi:enoyl-CoA hydratase